jgi:hypothetical protein
MKRQILRYAILMMVMVVLQCVVPLDGLRSVSASTQVNVNISIGAPPPVVVKARPTMVYLAEPAAYVAVGIPYDIYFVSGHYYYLHGNDWFWAQGYNGPWVYVSYNTLPPGLRKYRVERLHEFRERESKAYASQGPAFKGKSFAAEEHKADFKQGHGDDHDKGNGNSDGNGRGNSKKGN